MELQNFLKRKSNSLDNTNTFKFKNHEVKSENASIDNFNDDMAIEEQEEEEY